MTVTSTAPPNLLTQFEQIVTKYHDIPPKMVKAAGYFIVSTVLGRNVFVTSMPGRAPRPNVYFILGSEPAITHRSTLHAMIDYVLRECHSSEAPGTCRFACASGRRRLYRCRALLPA